MPAAWERYDDFRIYKIHAISAARGLLYSKDVIKRLHNAESIDEITKIMKSARKGTFKKEEFNGSKY